MVPRPSLNEFISAMSNFAGADVSVETWLGSEIGVDGEECSWMFMELERMLKRRISVSTDIGAYLPKYDGYWFFRPPYPDIKVRELYAFCEFGDGESK